MRVTFYGVRGSTPCPSPSNRRYGGNTAFVALEVDGEDPIAFDLGTGARFWGETQPMDGTFRGTALVTHIHWDHVQGLPFFMPINQKGARLDIYGPEQMEGPLGEVFSDFMRPPYFPVQYSDLHGDICFHDVMEEELSIGNAKVMVRPVPHCGPTVGYRVEWDGVSVAYISDHQAPLTLDKVDDRVLELCDGVDLLIHDAQFTPEEFQQRYYWGHCTVEYAVLVAREAGARKLALFHHDPSHDDDMIDELTRQAIETSASWHGAEVFAASERMSLSLEAAHRSA